MKLSSEQNSAIDAIRIWLRDTYKQQVFRLFGPAGTGKTSLAKHVAALCDNPIFAAYTGKAAYVLRQKGCGGATTLHRLIYCPQERSKKRAKAIKEKIDALPDRGVDTESDFLRDQLEQSLEFENNKINSPSFKLNPDSELRHADLLIIDEVSMVDETMAKHILSFKIKVLVLGDPAQLPPVMGTGYFINAKPDFMLTTIHRQALESPIIKMATQIRRGRMPQLGDPNVISIDELKENPTRILDYDQLLVGRNATRKSSNHRIRDMLGRETTLPQEKDRLVCLRNDHEVGLLNGGIWEVTTCLDTGDDSNTIDMVIQSEDKNSSLAVEAHKFHFECQGKETLPWWERKEAQEFDYGYALTVHKSQGSEWSKVIVFDESSVFKHNALKWAYTGATRAADDILWVIL